MKHLRIAGIVLLDVALLAVSLLNVPSLLHRPALPFSFSEQQGSLVVTEIADPSKATNLRAGDELKAWEGTVLSEKIVDFLLARSLSDERVTLNVVRNGNSEMAGVSLVQLHSSVYVLSVLLIGSSAWALALLLIVRRQDDEVAAIAHWGLIGLSLVITLVWEGPHPLHPMPGLADDLFFVGYVCASSFFLLFSLTFPARIIKSRVLPLLISFLAPLVALLPTAWYHQHSFAHGSLADFITFSLWFRFFHIVMWCLIILAATLLVWSYSRCREPETRRKIKWVLWGGAFGPAPFILFTAIPELLAPGWSVREEYTILSLILIPVGFGTAILKHKAFDIELVIRRSSTYTAVLGVVFSLCAIIIGSVASVLSYPPFLLAASSALLAVMLFEPLRRLVRGFVDRNFFLVQYDFRAEEKTLLDRIKKASDVTALAHDLVNETTRLIPCSSIGFFSLSPSQDRLIMIEGFGFDFLADKPVRFEHYHLKSTLKIPIALDTAVEPGVIFEPADRTVFDRWHLAIVFPALAQNGTPLAFMALGPKKSGARFTSEDVDLLSNLALQAGLALDRLAIQHELSLEHVENRRLAELNQLKTDFVSYVSHEFRTPLTTIKMFSDLLERPEYESNGKRREFLDIIRGETDRLERMVINILDSARIENNRLAFRFEATNLSEIAERALNQMQYRLSQQGFSVNQEFPDRSVEVRADPDYMSHAITNLIDNAIKYSCEQKRLWMSVAQDGNYGVCRIRDAGRGISHDALPHLFERFYRDPAYREGVQGTGVGLYLVKHIIDAHSGRIEVSSIPGAGSTFSLFIPLREHEDNSDH